MYKLLLDYLSFLRDAHVPLMSPRWEDLARSIRRLESKLSRASQADFSRIQRKLAKTVYRQRIVQDSKLSFADIG